MASESEGFVQLPDAGLLLYFRDSFVGYIGDPVHECNDDWDGRFQVNDPDEVTFAQVFEFKSFCEDWQRRLMRDPQKCGDAKEFDPFAGLVYSPDWSVRTANGQIWQLANAPLFWPDSGISWRIAPGDHSQHAQKISN